MEIDWQINLTKIKDRGQYILQSEKLADCRFLVGPSWNQSLVAGHRLLLAMASPVFERMFYGNLPEKDDPIFIPDVQPDAFEGMLDYIYTDEISISSFDHACHLYYVAKKYMLPYLVEHCTNFLLSDLSPKNACRAYEFGNLYEEIRLIESSMELFVSKTMEVVTDPSFMDIQASTLLAILDQNRLNVNSELDLFDCLLKFGNERGILNDEDKDNTSDAGSENASDIVVVEENNLKTDDSNSGVPSTSAGTCGNVSNVGNEVVEVDSSASACGNSTESAENVINIMDVQPTTIDEAVLRQAVKKIRFLTMTPQQFAEGPATSKLLKQNEALSIFINISSSIKNCPMPEGFSQLSKRDRLDHKHMVHFCISNPLLLMGGFQACKSSEKQCCLTFKVDTNIYLLGIQIKLETFRRSNIKGGSASIQNMQGSEIACANFKTGKNDSIDELLFNSPVFIYRNQNYNIKIIDKLSSQMLVSSWDLEKVCNGVKFSILPVNPSDINIGSAINGIVFSTY